MKKTEQEYKVHGNALNAIKKRMDYYGVSYAGRTDEEIWEHDMEYEEWSCEQAGKPTYEEHRKQNKK